MDPTTPATHSLGDTIALGAHFEPTDRATWEDRVRRDLKGRPLEKLSRVDEDGIVQDVLAETAPEGQGVPGAAPYVRGHRAVRQPEWLIEQRHGRGTAAMTAADIAEDIAGGTTAIRVRLDARARTAAYSTDALPRGTHGVQLDTPTDYQTVLGAAGAGGVPVHLEAGQSQREAARLFVDALAAAGRAESAAGGLGLDPLGTLARTGELWTTPDAALAEACALAIALGKKAPGLAWFDLDGSVFFDAGATYAETLGALVANGAAVLDALTAAGVESEAAARKLRFAVPVDADMRHGIAAVRAFRALWGRVLGAAGVSTFDADVRVVSAGRMLTARDPWVNMLRGTVAVFAGGVTGADAVTLLPHDAAGCDTHGEAASGMLARRAARNTQLVLMRESHLGVVHDPAGGSAALEGLTDALARRAWAKLQTVLGEGGLGQSLAEGALAGRIAESHAVRDAAIAKRKRPLTGVSMFPLLDERPVAPSGVSPLDAAEGALVDAPDAICVPALPLRRLSTAWEALRDAGDAAAAAGGRPVVALANIGSLAAYNARAMFAQNLLEAGGLAVSMGDGGDDLAAIAKAAADTGAKAACVCGTDAAYAAHGPALVTALKAAGIATVWLAGRPGEAKDALDAAGLDDHVALGTDVLKSLQTLHTALGLGRATDTTDSHEVTP